jgi:osmotically inducible protein OsmC
MLIRKGQAAWEGDLKSGKGTMKFGSGAFEGPYSFSSRFENGKGTNPEELIGAAHAGCFSMAFSGALTEAGFTPTKISTTAKVHLEKGPKGFTIVLVELMTEGQVPNIDSGKFQEIAEKSKQNCPVSRLLTGAEIRLDAKLLPETAGVGH